MSTAISERGAMEKSFHLSTRVPLDLEIINDQKHLELCYKGFSTENILSDKDKELEALMALSDIRGYCKFRSLIMWTYCLHYGEELSEFAFTLLPSSHQET